MISEKAGNEWKRSHMTRKESRRQLTLRESKRSSQTKRKRPSQESTRKSHIKLDLKSKLTKQRGKTSRNMSIRKRGTFENGKKPSAKGFTKRKSRDKSRKAVNALGQSRRLSRKTEKQGLMGMLRRKVQRSQKNLSRMAQNFQSRVKEMTPKTKDNGASKYRSHNQSKDSKLKSSFKMKENRTNWQIKLKKKKFEPKKIERVIKAFDERCRRIDKKLGSKKSKKKKRSVDINKSKIKERFKHSLRSPPESLKAEQREAKNRPKDFIENQLKSTRLEISGVTNKRRKKKPKENRNSEYMLRPIKVKEKSSVDSLGLSRQSSRQQFSMRKTFKESTISENEMTNLNGANQKERGALQKSGKSTVGLWSSSIRNIHQTQNKPQLTKKVRSTTAREKKKETKELKKFLSPERIKNYLLKEKPKSKFGNEPSREFFFKYKRGGSKTNLDSQFEKSRSRVLTGEKTPNSKKNHKAFDSIKNSGGGNKAEGNLVESRWDLKVGDFEKLVESFHEVGVKVGLKKTQGVVQIQEHLIKIEAFVNCLIGMFIVF